MKPNQKQIAADDLILRIEKQASIVREENKQNRYKIRLLSENQGILKRERKLICDMLSHLKKTKTGKA